MDNNKGTIILNKDESLKLMKSLMSRGILRRAELLRYGVRLCTIIEYWKSEKDYMKYGESVHREPKPLILIRKSQDVLQEQKKIVSITAFLKKLGNAKLVYEDKEAINKAALDKLNRDIERREAAQSVQDYYFKKVI